MFLVFLKKKLFARKREKKRNTVLYLSKEVTTTGNLFPLIVVSRPSFLNMVLPKARIVSRGPLSSRGYCDQV